MQVDNISSTKTMWLSPRLQRDKNQGVNELKNFEDYNLNRKQGTQVYINMKKINKTNLSTLMVADSDLTT